MAENSGTVKTSMKRRTRMFSYLHTTLYTSTGYMLRKRYYINHCFLYFSIHNRYLYFNINNYCFLYYNV